MPKADSFFDMIEETDADFVLITETWFCNSVETDSFLDRAEGEFGLSSINRMRPRKGRNNPGGRLSLLFRKSSVHFTEYKIKRAGHEIICARAKLTGVSRPIFVIGTYPSPKLKAEQYHESLSLVSEALLKIKSETNNPYLIVMGDFNGKDIQEAIGN